MRAKSSSSTGPKVFLSKAAKEKRDTADKRHKLESGSTYDSEADIIERGLSLLSIDSDDWPVGLDSLDADSDAAWESMCDKALGVTTDEN
jgi:hypothetical protein